MQEQQAQAPVEVPTAVLQPELAVVPDAEITKALDAAAARAAVENAVISSRQDVNFEDEGMTEAERKLLLDSLVANIDCLNAAVLSDGQKFVDYIRISPNNVDEKLINLELSIPIDGFIISGVYDITRLKNIISTISQRLPINPPGEAGDANAAVRKKAEQKLVDEDLNAKIAGSQVIPDSQDDIPANEISEEFALDNHPPVQELTGLPRIKRYWEKTVKLIV